jgi:hypothetical protein
VPNVDGTHPTTAQFTGAYLELFEYQAPDGTLQLVDNAPASASALAELQSHNTGSIATGGGTIDLIAGPITTPPDLSPLPLLAVHGEGPGAAATLTLAALAPIVQEAIHRWADAGLTPHQMEALAGLQFSIGDLPNGVLGQEINLGRVVLDDNGAGWGWFVDPTPGDDREFNAVHSSTEAAATSGDAAAGMDLLTVVMHEIGHAIGLDDAENPGRLMDDAVDLGTRRVPDAADTAHATEAALPASAQAPESAPVIAGTAGNDTIDFGAGGNIVTGGSGADAFVFDQVPQPTAPAPAAVSHVADYSALQGDTIDLSAITGGMTGPYVTDAMLIRAAEDGSGAFATLQVNVPNGIDRNEHWVDIAQVDGVHAGDALNVVLDPSHALHQIHAEWLV